MKLGVVYQIQSRIDRCIHTIGKRVNGLNEVLTTLKRLLLSYDFGTILGLYINNVLMNFFKRKLGRMGAVLLSALALAVFVVPVYAHVSWCSSDPIVRLSDGSVFNVVVEAPIEYVGSQVGVNIVTQEGAQLVDVPEGALDLDVDFKANGEEPRFGVTVNPVGNFPLRVIVLKNNVVVAEQEGVSGATVHVQLNTL